MRRRPYRRSMTCGLYVTTPRQALEQECQTHAFLAVFDAQQRGPILFSFLKDTP